MRAHAKWCSSSCTMKGYRAANPGRQRAYWIKSVYGLTAEAFDEMFSAQGGRCGICGTDQPSGEGKIAQWNIDHCHDSGAVRGILCSPCNIGIGQLRDDPSLLRKALAYLEGTPTQG